MKRLALAIIAVGVALLVQAPAHAYQRDACATLYAIASDDPDSDRRDVASQAYFMLDCANAAAGSVLVGDGPGSTASMVGEWDGDWGGWIGVWTFRADGTYSHNLGEGVVEECRHGTYSFGGGQLQMRYVGGNDPCISETVTGTLSRDGGAVTGSSSSGATIYLTRR